MQDKQRQEGRQDDAQGSDGVRGGAVIGRARRRAGLSQEELSRRLGTTKSALSRWENGHVDPSFGTVDRAVRATGLRLEDVLAEPHADKHDLGLMETSLRLSPSERLQRLIDFVRFVEAARR
jgi:transcriptional regulator with XRE-family HTH domain